MPAPRSSAPRSPAPTLEREHELLGAGHGWVAGMDEVGRGALAGPVTVGAVLVTAATPAPPADLRDSKLLSPAAREALVPVLEGWAPAWGVGHARSDEVDDLGVLAALGLAGRRALERAGARAGAVLLDGDRDYLTAALDGARPAGSRASAGGAPGTGALPRVVTRVRADVACASVAAASVLAKVARDALMVALAREHPRYGWGSNKGYGAPAHLAALVEHGPCAQHRLSWALPGGTGEDGPARAGRRARAGARGRSRPPAATRCMMGRDER